jgi:XTP/dITP diphosphohydrolase
VIRKIVLASGNKGKLAEMQRLLAGLGVEIVAQSELGVPEALEDGLSFVENSLIKARNAAKHSGLPAIADDSGIAVDALDGAPGIYSARYAGENVSDSDNVDKLLAEMKGVSNRAASFYCALTFVRHHADPIPLVATAAWQGSVATAKSGGGGFGYDPVFEVDSSGKTAAELSKDEKSAISHRGQATQLLLAQLHAVLST